MRTRGQASPCMFKAVHFKPQHCAPVSGGRYRNMFPFARSRLTKSPRLQKGPRQNVVNPGTSTCAVCRTI